MTQITSIFHHADDHIGFQQRSFKGLERDILFMAASLERPDLAAALKRALQANDRVTARTLRTVRICIQRCGVDHAVAYLAKVAEPRQQTTWSKRSRDILQVTRAVNRIGEAPHKKRALALPDPCAGIGDEPEGKQQ